MTNQSRFKPDKLYVDRGKEVYKSFMEKRLNDNDVLMYSIHSEDKSVVVRGL